MNSFVYFYWIVVFPDHLLHIFRLGIQFINGMDLFSIDIDL